MIYKILVLLTFTLLACKSNSEKPENLLSKAQMVELLIDIHILEGKLDKLRIQRDSSTVLYNTFEREILKAHNIDKALYKSSYQYYLEEVNSMDEIYTAVVDSLNFLQTSHDAKMEIARKKEKEEKENKKNEQTKIELDKKKIKSFNKKPVIPIKDK